MSVFFLVVISVLLLCVFVFCLLIYFQLRMQNNAKLLDLIQPYFNQQRDSSEQLQNQFLMQLKENRTELQQSLSTFQDGLLKRINENFNTQKNQLDIFAKQLSVVSNTTDQKLSMVRETLEKRLQVLQEDNNKKLEQMRATVDEKLHQTLEKRLGESFKIVSDRLEMVHKGLGEMQHLATGVGDLKKVLSNVKTRGIWGEIHLSQLLEQLLTQDQYDSQVRTKKGSNDAVDFAIKLPGKLDNGDAVWLPIDAKFPLEAYQALYDAQDQGDKEQAELMKKQLESRVKLEAKTISEKYIDPPHTTDFSVLYFPTEGLYAEVLRLSGLQELLQTKYKVLIAGPTTFAALLNSLQMGFRTLAIEKRSSEVWTLLGTVKTEFGKFGDILDKTYKKLQEAGNTIDTAARKSRTIERKLRSVQDVPSLEAKTFVAADSLEKNEPLTLDHFTTL